jgi:hypothetical protein
MAGSRYIVRHERERERERREEGGRLPCHKENYLKTHCPTRML